MAVKTLEFCLKWTVYAQKLQQWSTMCVYVHIFFIYTGWEKTKQVGTEPLNWEVCEQHVPTMVRVPGHSTHHYSSLRIISAVLFTNVMLLGLQLQFEGSRIGERDRAGKSWKDDSWITFLYGTATICFTKSMTGTSPKGSKRIQNLRKCEASSRLDACTAAGYSIAYYPEKVPADRDWPGIQEAVSCCGHSSFMRGLVTECTVTLCGIPFCWHSAILRLCASHQMIHAFRPSRGCTLPTTCLQLLDCRF
jgi:hypothetical protein